MQENQGDFFGTLAPEIEIREQTATQNQEEMGYQPLAARLRPRKLEEILGQEHLLGPNCLLPRLIRQNSFGNIILYGPPGCGKTSLAQVIAHETDCKFIKINAVLSNVSELRNVLQVARKINHPTLLFIDEIHRFNRAQQDLLLPDLESGTLRLIGATTYHPGLYVIPPLLSRSHLFQLEPLSPDGIENFLEMAVADCDRGLGNCQCTVEKNVLRAIASTCDGDLRRALNNLETLVTSAPNGSHIDEKILEKFGQERNIRYDHNESEHHATISAFIKSMRGNSPDSAIYWLAKMLEGGEDPRFIARRLTIFASEDVGLADPHALPLAVACFDACEKVGLPECAINLAHVTTYMALAPKTNSAYMALARARKSLKSEPIQPVPNFLRNHPSNVAGRLADDTTYHYSHDYEYNHSGQQYMTEPKKFYFPKPIGMEKKLAERWEEIQNNPPKRWNIPGFRSD